MVATCIINDFFSNLSVESLNNIKYAAYRTAMKLRAIQKKTQCK